MIGPSAKHPPVSEKPKPTPEEKRHRDELLDEALKETFPASDAAAMLEPAPGPPPKKREGQK